MIIKSNRSSRPRAAGTPPRPAALPEERPLPPAPRRRRGAGLSLCLVPVCQRTDPRKGRARGKRFPESERKGTHSARNGKGKTQLFLKKTKKEGKRRERGAERGGKTRTGERRRAAFLRRGVRAGRLRGENVFRPRTKNIFSAERGNFLRGGFRSPPQCFYSNPQDTEKQ